MDDKHTMGSVPPYEANPSHGMQHTGSYGMGAPSGQPMVQQDIYQQPISPMQTGQAYHQHPISPMQTGQTYPQQPQHTGSMSQIYPQQTGNMASPGNEKHEYYSGQQPPVQQQPSGAVPMQQQMQASQTYQHATPIQSLTGIAAPVDCPMCRHRAMTRIEHHAGNTTHVWALVLCACFCLGCIPYLLNSVKDVEHKCGNCGCMLATWHRSGRVDVHAHA